MPRGYKRKNGKLERDEPMDIGPYLTISSGAMYSPYTVSQEQVLDDVQRKREVLEADLAYITKWLNEFKEIG